MVVIVLLEHVRLEVTLVIIVIAGH